MARVMVGQASVPARLRRQGRLRHQASNSLAASELSVTNRKLADNLGPSLTLPVAGIGNREGS